MNKFKEYKELKELTISVKTLTFATYDFIYKTRTEDSELNQIKKSLHEQLTLLDKKYFETEKELDKLEWELKEQFRKEQ